MIERLSYSELDKLILDGQSAFSYAEEHFDALMSREVSYTLFGPVSYGMGATSPARSTKSKERILSKNANRKKYTVYELDENYQVLYHKIIENYNNVHCTYLHFELNGVHYARPFSKSEKKFYADIVYAVKFEDGNPLYYAESSASHLMAEFYDYIFDEKMIVTTYAYHPHSRFTVNGIPTVKDAPVGAENSTAHVFQSEEPIRYIDFSHWFDKI